MTDFPGQNRHADFACDEEVADLDHHRVSNGSPPGANVIEFDAYLEQFDDQTSARRLTQQVERLAIRLECLHRAMAEGGIFQFDQPSDPLGEHLLKDKRSRVARAPLPEPRLLREIIRQRQLRLKYFECGLFADPAWDILLDLAEARATYKRVSVTSLCYASGVPPTTALRWIAQMIEDGLLERVGDPSDKRRAFVTLTDEAASKMAEYFAELGRSSVRVI